MRSPDVREAPPVGGASAPPWRVPTLVGPTASGKTALSLRLAEVWEGEIISMDSRQVYRGLDIGTDKVALADRARAPHHGLDRVEPDERYSAGRFAREATAWIEDIVERGRQPVLVGGTGFFLRALTEPIFAEPPLDPLRREQLRAWLAARPLPELARWADALDPERAALARAGGRQRVQRVLEVALLTGRALSEWHQRSAGPPPRVRAWVVLLELPREEMDRRIDARVERMITGGLADEVRALRAQGYRREHPGLTGTGYREMWDVLEGTRSLADAAAEMKRQTRQYARRQLTWFRNQLPDVAVRLEATRPLEDQVRVVVDHWEEERRAA
ncbi:MAG: tRNA (adenosine(37)-N6)-dimethylallyltransferase MiaA [Gemmatimonadota bacterium]